MHFGPSHKRLLKQKIRHDNFVCILYDALTPSIMKNGNKTGATRGVRDGFIEDTHRPPTRPSMLRRGRGPQWGPMAARRWGTTQ